MKYLLAIITIVALAGWFLPTFDGIGAVSFPTSLDTFTNPGATDSQATVSHSGQHSDANDAIEALQAKVGVASSTVQSSHSFKLKDIFGGNKAASISGSETLTNKTLTSPTINNATLATTTLTASTTFLLGNDATGDLYYRNANGGISRLAIGTNGQQLQVSGGLPSWQTPSGSTVLVRAYLSTDSLNVPSGSSLIQFNSESFDTGGDFSTSTYQFTAPSDGYYRIGVNGNTKDNSGSPKYVRFLVNNATTSVAYTSEDWTNGESEFKLNDLLNLSTNDVVGVAFEATEADIDIVGGATSTVLTIEKI